jgi:hypothetical protein
MQEQGFRLGLGLGVVVRVRAREPLRLGVLVTVWKGLVCYVIMGRC